MAHACSVCAQSDHASVSLLLPVLSGACQNDGKRAIRRAAPGSFLLFELSRFSRKRSGASPAGIGMEQGLWPCLVLLSSPVEACLGQGGLPARKLRRVPGRGGELPVPMAR